MTKTQEFRQTSSCPKCGAPIYVDANLTKGKNGEVLTVLPTPHYTCACRITGVTYVQPLDKGNAWDGLWPPRGENINVLDDGHRTFCQSDLYKSFFGSGGVSQDPDRHYVILNSAR